jgi:hypothetical protein
MERTQEIADFIAAAVVAVVLLWGIAFAIGLIRFIVACWRTRK